MTRSLFIFLVTAVSIAANAATRLAQEFNVNGGKFYCLEISGSFGSADATNEQAIGVAHIEFSNRYGRVKTRGSFVSGISTNDSYRGCEYLFPDTAVCSCGTNQWHFQFRVPDAADKVSVEVKPWENIDDVDFSTMELKSTYSTMPKIEDSEKTLYPGQFDNMINITGRTSLPATLRVSLHNANTTKPFFVTNVRSTATNEFRLALPLTSPVISEIIVKAQLKNDKQSNAELKRFKAASRFMPIALPSTAKPTWFQIPTRQADSLSVSGNLVAHGTSGRNAKSGLMQIDFIDSDGKSITIHNMPRSEKYGNYSYLHSGNSPTNGDFKISIPIPKSARALRLGFSRWAIPSKQTLSGLKVNLSYDQFKLPSYIKTLGKGGIDNKPVKRFLFEHLRTNILELAKARDSFPRYKTSQFQGHLHRSSEFSSGDAFSLNDYLDFNASTKTDCFPSSFCSAAWLFRYDYGFRLQLRDDIECRYRHCHDAWFEFWRQNGFYPSTAESMAAENENQLLAARRIEAILIIMFGLEDNIDFRTPIPPLWNRIAADEEFLSMLMCQLCLDVGIVDEYLRVNRSGVHIPNLTMAKALLLFSDAFPMLEISNQYKHVALNSISRHFRNLYGQDGFIREQSSAYHHEFIQHLLDSYQYFIDNKIVDSARIKKMELLIETILRVDAEVCFPDEGQFIPIGDTEDALQRPELRQYVETFKKTANPSQKIPVEFGDMTRFTTLKDSGLYIFRNTATGKMLVIDISPNKMAHGHYDCGSYHYFSDGIRWIGDRGGPYKHSSRQQRELMSSASHSVACPANANQMAGIAYNVKFHKYKKGYVFSFWTNVYGSEHRHTREFIIEKDLSSFSVEDTFYGPKTAGYVNRMVLGKDVDVELENATGCAAVVRSGTSALHIQSSHKMHALESTASYTTNDLSPIKVLVADGHPDEKGEMRFQYTVEASTNTTRTLSK